MPNSEVRVRLLEIFLSAKPLGFSPAEVSRAVAEKSLGLSGRDIKSWIARAEHKAVQRAITQDGPAALHPHSRRSRQVSRLPLTGRLAKIIDAASADQMFGSGSNPRPLPW